MKTIRHSDRPKWAKPLSAQTWKNLHTCQAGTPTLKGLRRDFEHQVNHGIRCWTCIDAMRAIGGLPENFDPFFREATVKKEAP